MTALILLSVLLTSCSGAEAKDISAEKTWKPVSETVFAMDTCMTITAYGKNAQKAVDESVKKINALNDLWNVNDEKSDIYKINHSTEPVEINAETMDLLRFALDMSEKTDGALDVTLYPVLREWGFTTGEYRVPDDETITAMLELTGTEKITAGGNKVTTPDGVMLDLGSVGKGRTGDIIAEIMKQNGVTSALIDLGGNVQTVGRKTDGSKWKIGLKNPYGDGYFGIIETEDKAVITSGGYERFFEHNGETYWHILDPKNGRPAKSGLVSVTAIGSEGKLCDALSTALFVMGEEKAAEYWRGHEGFETVLVTEDGRVLISEGLADSYTDKGIFDSVEVIKRV